MMTSRKTNASRHRELPFYEPGSSRKTSAQIVSEARASIKTLKTTRPHTPTSADRTLMGKARATLGRPPSVYSIGERHFIDDLSRPGSSSSGNASVAPLGRLAPLEQRTVPQVDEARVDGGHASLVPKPPPSKNRRSSMRRHTGSGRLQTEIRETDEDLAPTELKSDLTVETSSGMVRPNEQFAVPQKVGSKSPKGSKHVRSQQANKPQTDGVQHHNQTRINHEAHQTESPRLENKKVHERPKERRASGTDSFYEERVRPLLERLTVSTGISDLSPAVSELHRLLEEGNMLGRGAGKRRTRILRTLFNLLDIDDPRLLLRLARLILALHVTQSNLTNTCKLLFKLSKTESNDLLFLEEKLCGNMLAVVRMSDPVTYCEALVYCVGALKLLSGNTQIQKELGEQDGISALSELVATINTVSQSDRTSLSTYTGSLLVQVTATLRNLADVSDHRNNFLSGAVIENLCPLMDTFGDDADLMLNISRIFSKLTQHSSCKMVLCQRPGSLQSILKLLLQHITNHDLVVRLCFVLGNLTRRDDTARSMLYFTCCCMEPLLHVFEVYIKLDEEASGNLHNDKDDKDVSNTNKLSPTEDVLVKLVRVIANLAVHPNVGSALALSESCVENLIRLLGYKDVSMCEELVLNAVATINNLSFYGISGTAVAKHQLVITDLLVDVLLSQSMDAMIEAFRVFGNLTRSKEVRQILASRQVDRMLLTVLDSGRRDVVYSSCGVLVNMMADSENWKTLQDEDGVRKLIDILRDFGQFDWMLGSLVCKVLSNFSVKMSSSDEWFGNDQVISLMDILSEQLDEESALSLPGDVSKDVQDFLRQTWTEEFCPVAQSLLARIQSCYRELEPI